MKRTPAPVWFSQAWRDRAERRLRLESTARPHTADRNSRESVPDIFFRMTLFADAGDYETIRWVFRAISRVSRASLVPDQAARCEASRCVLPLVECLPRGRRR